MSEDKSDKQWVENAKEIIDSENEQTDELFKSDIEIYKEYRRGFYETLDISGYNPYQFPQALSDDYAKYLEKALKQSRENTLREFWKNIELECDINNDGTTCLTTMELQEIINKMITKGE